MDIVSGWVQAVRVCLFLGLSATAVVLVVDVIVDCVFSKHRVLLVIAIVSAVAAGNVGLFYAAFSADNK